MTIELYKSPWKAIKLFALTIPLVIIGVWLIVRTESSLIDKILGWISTSFFGFGFLLSFYHLFDRRPQIIINEKGVWHRTTNQEMIKWEQINKAIPIDIYGQKFVSLTVDKSFEFKKKPYKWSRKLNKMVGADDLNLNFGQMKYDSKKMAIFIKEMIKIEREDRANLIVKYFKYQ